MNTWETICPDSWKGFLRIKFMSIFLQSGEIAPLCMYCLKNRACYRAEAMYKDVQVALVICRGCHDVCFWTEEEIEKMLANRCPRELQLKLPLGA